MHHYNQQPPVGVPPSPSLPNKQPPVGVPSQQVHQIPSCYLPEHTTISSQPDSTHCNGSSLGSVMNGGSSRHQSIQAVNDSPVVTMKMDASTSMLSAQNSNMGRLHGMDGQTIKPEPIYTSNSDFAFCTDGSFLDARPAIEDAPGASFRSSELTGPPLNEPLLDIDESPFGNLSQIPQNFSFSDLTVDFSEDILANYGRSPFLAPETNTFIDSPETEFNEGENRRLDTISEGLSYEDFGSD